ncbi:hemicentin-1-like isoform X2 [Parambassis ranga]|uniref:Hemicentin-1-like isoform X2 n=1 Tax=Parambassis ranga TaxID=210632 RepID=A0A6P7J4J6_9TELE|nr:hemicentin-1-like isoform X2 [Parambassis ranga]
MEAEFGLLMMILGLSLGVDTYCDGRQGGAQCYGVLGASVTLRLMDDASEIFRFQWRKESSVILKWRNNKITNTLQYRSEFILSNGTFRINNLSRDDGGEYVLEIHDNSGRLTSQQSLHLSVEAPVSSVLLTSECLTSGQKRLSCSSGGGDSPQWSWTLDGRPLTDAELDSGNSETNNITVKQGVSGYLVCTVSNHVSRVCGFVDIKCELSNEKQRSEQVFESNHTVCVKPTTAPTTTTTTTTTVGVDTYCDGRQDGAQCYRAVGASVTLGLMDDASEIPSFDWNKGSSAILKWRNNKIKNTLQDRSEFIPSNGTFRINNLSRDDGGEYVLEIHDNSGRLTSRRSLHLSVEAPVSSVLLTSECLTSGQKRLSCSSGGGDSPQWSWTLDGRPLTDAELESGNSETNNITVKQGVSGYLVCTVSNHVSRVCGFVDIKCELSNEKQRSDQVFESNHTVCVKPTTAPTTTTTVDHSLLV